MILDSQRKLDKIKKINYRFGIFTTKIKLSPDKVANIVLATILLHNMFREQSKEFYTPDGFIDVEDNDMETIKVVGEMTESAVLLTPWAEIRTTIYRFAMRVSNV